MNDILPVLASPEDSRDRIAAVGEVALPEQVELDVYEVEDQKQHGSCLANAICSALEIYAKRAGKPRDYSRMYTYWWIRALSKLHGQDSGGFPRDMVKAVSKFGACDESLYPYDAGNLFKVPSEEAIIQGIGNGDWMYERIPVPGMYDGVPQFTATNIAIKTQLAAGIPVLLTLDLDSDFTPSATGKTWRESDWHKTYKPGLTPKGGHETLIVGYDDRHVVKRFKVLNSWGAQWGDQGYFGLMYQPLKSQVWQARVIKELWVVKPK